SAIWIIKFKVANVVFFNLILILRPPNNFIAMKSKANDLSTVIIVNKNRQRTLQVKTKHLNRLKHYALSIFGLILILSASIFYLRSQNKRQEAEKNQLLSQL